MTQRTTYRAAVYVIPQQENQILLFRRYNTGFGDGQYSFIAGHVEAGESVTQAAVREAAEEAGIVLAPQDLHFVHVLHRHSADDLVYFDFFFTTEHWQGEPSVREPHRCDGMCWAPLFELPPNTLPYVRQVVEAIGAQTSTYSEHGWIDETESPP